MNMSFWAVVQAVVKANSESNRNGQISIPCGSKTPERISMKLGLETVSIAEPLQNRQHAQNP